MLREVREDGGPSSGATSFSGTGRRVLRMGVGVGKLVGSWSSFCLIHFISLCEVKGKTWLKVKGVLKPA